MSRKTRNLVDSSLQLDDIYSIQINGVHNSTALIHKEEVVHVYKGMIKLPSNSV